jgi:Tol biopolymer transport system component
MSANLTRFLFFLAATAGLSIRTSAAEVPAGESRFLSNPRQLILEGKRSGEGYFAPDGRSLLFQSEREAGNPFYQIYLLDFDSGDIHRVSPGSGKTTCAFFRPGHDEVLFASTHLDPQTTARQQEEFQLRASGKQRRYAWDYDAAMDIFSARRDGGDLRRLTKTEGYDAEGSYSPDGRLIVFCSLRDAYPTNRLSAEERKRLETDPAWFGEIYLMNADGSEPRRLTRSPGYDGGPFFSPDGQRIVWRRFDEQGVNADVYTMKTDGSDVQRLTDFGAMSWAPYFHPSGRYLIFTANKLGFSNFELFLVDAAGQREPVRVTFTDGFDGLPVFSPDGAQLCWTSGRTADGKSQLFLADWNHASALDILAQAPLRGESTTGASSPAPAPESAGGGRLGSSISTNDLLRHIQKLASPELEGRATGSAGAKQAAAYLTERLLHDGWQPIGKSSDLLQEFTFNAGVRLLTNASEFILKSGPTSVSYRVEQDFRPLSFSANALIEGEVVFAGYGLSMPGKSGEGYDSYAGINVSNKLALVLRYVPEGVSAARRTELNRYAGMRYKAMLAREHGAKAILFFTGPNSPNAGALAELTFDTTLAGSGIVAASISSNVVEALLTGSGRTAKTLQDALDTENPHAETGFAVPGARVRLATQLEHLKKSDHNVVAILPSKAEPAPAEWVLLGAHYDHLGFGESGNAMQRKGEEHQIHPGADDNASGTAAVLELAQALAAIQRDRPQPFRRRLAVAFWSGEEIGLIGSSHFAEHPPLPLSNLVAYINFDMVGRLKDNKLILQGVGSSSTWRKVIEKRNVAAGFNLTLQDDPYLPTDTTALYPKGVPVVNFFTGSHDDYHRPTDLPGTLNYPGLERITRFAQALVLDLLQAPERPDYLAVARADAGGGSRESLRAYLGTIPDYATEVAGVKLSGVRAGGPADKAGLKGGDVIIEFGGKKIANIYDYTYAMDAVKIGQPVPVIILRDGQRVSLNVTPEARR